jgi:hypothetical protein
MKEVLQPPPQPTRSGLCRQAIRRPSRGYQEAVGMLGTATMLDSPNLKLSLEKYFSEF